MSARESDIAFVPNNQYRVSMWGLAAVATTTARSPVSEDRQLRRRAPIYKQLTIEDRFRILSQRWKQESQPLSSTSEMARLGSYRQIILMGRQAIPLLLRELQREPDYWFMALEEISGTNPVRDNERGRLQLMADAWLRWGREQGQI